MCAIRKICSSVHNTCRCLCCLYTGGKVRLATFELAILLLKSLVYSSADGRSFLQDDHLAAIEGAREEATLQMRNYYKVWEKVCFCNEYIGNCSS